LSELAAEGERPVSRVDWRRNLAALWFAEFMAIMGFSFAFPFLSLFLNHDLGIRTERDLAFWTGVSASASGFTMALASPIWGLLADRYGRKPMLLRSMLGGGITVALMGIARNALDLTLFRFLQGATSGTVAAATALTASETPRERVGFALGVLTSAIALGSAVGPVVGGLAVLTFGYRNVFFVGGVLLIAATLPVLIVVKESPRRSAVEKPVALTEAIRSQAPGTMRAIVVLIVCQGLVVVFYTAFQQLAVLKLLGILSTAAASATGYAFGAAGVATTVSAITYAWIATRIGYRRLALGAMLSVAAAIAFLAVTRDTVLIIVAVAFSGLLYGAVTPGLSSMLGLESPTAVQGRIFGISASSISLGFAFGPLLVGVVASTAGVTTGLWVTAAVAVITAAVLAIWGREPQR
jgi:MFS family permease